MNSGRGQLAPVRRASTSSMTAQALQSVSCNVSADEHFLMKPGIWDTRLSLRDIRTARRACTGRAQLAERRRRRRRRRQLLRRPWSPHCRYLLDAAVVPAAARTLPAQAWPPRSRACGPSAAFTTPVACRGQRGGRATGDVDCRWPQLTPPAKVTPPPGLPLPGRAAGRTG